MAKRQRPREEEIDKRREKALRQEERSISYFGRDVQEFNVSVEKMTQTMGVFVKSVDAFKKTIEKQAKESKKGDGTGSDSGSGGGGGKRKPKALTENQQWAKKTQAGISKFQSDAEKLGFKRIQNFTQDVFGKKTAQNMTKSMARFSGYIGPKGAGGGFGKGVAGRLAGAGGSALGGIMRLAGPAGAIFSAAKMIFDFWDGGGFAKMKVGAKMIFGGKKMNTAADRADVIKSLEGTKQMRELNAEYNYKVPMQLRHQAADDMLNYQKGIEQDRMTYEHGLVKDQIDFEMGLRSDAMQFAHQQAMETMDAEFDRRKAINASGMSFISQYAKISERALRAIGSSTKAILEGVAKFQTVFGLGIKQTFQLSENAQGLAYHFGTGAEDVMQMTNAFRLMNRSSAGMATKLVQGLSQFAIVNDIAPQALFHQMKEAGEDIYKFSNGTAENFARQAALLDKMSVSMSAMMKASDTMVLNYKDSIKAEMGLSAMLGKNINLSEVRARLMGGDQAGAAQALKSQLAGVDINTMNPFAKQQLMQATGMSIDQLMGLQQGKGGGLKNEQLTAAEKNGKAFADGALKQDIANAGAKLAAEQAMKKKMMEFEQQKRLVMLDVEQAQRLDGIFLEQKYRVLAAEKGYEQAKEEMAVDLIKNQASGFMANQMAGTASALDKQGLSDAAIQKFTTTVQGVDTSVQNMISSGRVKGGDMRLADYAMKKFDILQNAKGKSAEEIEVALQKAMQSTFGQDYTNMRNDQIRTAAEEEERKKFFAEQKAAVDAKANAEKEIQRLRDEFSKKSLDIYNSNTYHQNRKWAMEGNGPTQQLRKSIDAQIEAQKAIIEKSKITSKQLFDPIELAKRTVAAGQKAVAEQKLPGDVKPSTDTKSVAKSTADANKPVVNASNKTANVTAEVKASTDKNVAISTQTLAQQTRTLSEFEYSSKILLEQLAMMGLSAQMLDAIAQNTKGDKEVVLDGRMIRKNLLDQSRRNYGVSRTVTVS